MGAGQVVRTTNKALMAQLRTLGTATSPEMKGAAKALKKGIQKAIGPVSKTVSRPGEPPKGKTGGLKKSVKEGIVGAGRRVAVTKFTAPFLQWGVDTIADANAAAPRSRRNLFTGAAETVQAQSNKAFRRRQRQRSRGDARRRPTVLAPRPFMEKGLQNAEGEMTAVVVSAIRRRTASASTL